MSSIEYIKQQVELGATPPTPDAGRVKLYRNTDGLWYEVDSTGTERIANWELLRPIFFTQPAIVTHLNAVADTVTNVASPNITLPFDGDYLLNISFNYNVDANNAYGKVYATFDGNALDLNDRAADPQGDNQILVVEMKDNGNTSGGAITGTGSGMKMPYHMQFLLTGQTAGTYPLVIDIGCQTGSVEASLWNLIVKFERVA